MTNLQKNASRFAASAARAFTDTRFATANAVAGNTRSLAIVTLGWLLDRARTWRAAVRVLIVSAIVAVLGWYAGWYGFGSALVIHDHATIRFWHVFMAPFSAVALPAFRYTLGLVARFFEARGMNAFALGLFAFPFYAAVVAIVFVAWGLWTFPVYIVAQAAKIVVAAFTPLLRRELNRLAADVNVDVAAKIVRDMARANR